MKLRNKNTGEIIDAIFEPCEGNVKVINKDEPSLYGEYGYLSELNKEWEDYTTAEPLIKDKKIRKAVRAWAEANDFINEIKVEGLNAGTRFSEGHWSIEFIGYFIYDLKIDSIYTIAELCGEEEE